MAEPNLNEVAMQQLAQVENQIAMMDGQLAVMAGMDMSKSSNTRFMIALYDEMSKQGMGQFGKYIGRMSIRVSDQFWQNEERASRIITNFVSSYKKMYELFKENFGHDADQVLADNFYQTRFSA